ncbi:MATE family efflux transporter [Curvibacter sp. RS43]|uniref:MATE family efflux transporter n=1 Tax=Curvibacter microcysteis TaxID=3026419 RepID=UPI002361BFE1|nr:MATE family efflux transporter [Curvibacter sp. RS43]MDD0811055.1 MATE family efflux transporter [Curvibacter sp. RS43]
MSTTAAAASAAPPDTRPLWRVFLGFLGPMLVSNILQALSGTINNIYIGQILGVQAMAAVSGFFPVAFFCVSFIIGLGAGSSVLIGQAWGAREPSRVKAIAGTALCVALLLGLVVALLGGSFTGALMQALGTPANILDEATSYARIVLLNMPLMFLFLLSTAMLRGVSDTVTPLRALLLSTVLGLVFTPAFILGWLGLPKMGVASGALASVLSTACALLWLGWHLRRRLHPLAPDAELLRHLRIQPQLLATVLRIGVPTGLQMIVISLAELALLSLVNGFGSDATAAYGAVNQIVAYVQFPAISIAITASILGAQAIGAGRSERLGAIARTGLLMNLVLTGSLVSVAYLFSRPVIGFFITSAPVLELAQSLLHIMLWSSVVFGMASVLSGVMRASGSVLVPTLISIFCILGVEVPVAVLASRQIGIEGVWLAYPVAFIAMLVLQGTYYRLVWRRRPIRRLV